MFSCEVSRNVSKRDTVTPIFQLRNLRGSLRLNSCRLAVLGSRNLCGIMPDISPHALASMLPPPIGIKETEAQLDSRTCPAHQASQQKCLGESSDLPLSRMVACLSFTQGHLLRGILL